MKSKTGTPIMRDQGGYVLVISMLVLVLLTLTAVFAAHQSSTEMRIAGNNKSTMQAFYMAQAGLQDAKVRLLTMAEKAPYTSGWSTSFNSSGSLHYAVALRHKTELDYGEDKNSNSSYADIVFWGDANGDGVAEQNIGSGAPIEIAKSTGTTGSAKALLTAEFTRDFIEMKYAAFGDLEVQIDNGGIVAKGTNSTGINTSPPYLANLGSNKLVELKNKSDVYGDIDLGKSTTGSQGQLKNTGSTIYGTAPNYIDRIDPDPLGLFTSGSQLNKDFQTYSSSNDNAKAVTIKNGTVTSTGLTNRQISVDKDEIMTLTAGNYYVSSIQLKGGSTLKIDVSSGPVNIYLTGGVEFKVDAHFNIVPSGSLAEKFMIYSNSSDNIVIKNSEYFTGLIYAPHAGIIVDNEGDFYGMAWGKSVEIKNSGELVYDPRVKHKFLANSYSLFSWKEHRD